MREAPPFDSDETQAATTQATGDASVPTSILEAKLAPGTVIDRYIVLHELGAGGMGAVYAAIDPELDRKVALKLLLSRTSDAGRIRLLREAQALAKLSHPNVVAIHDVGTVDGQVWLAMELVQGTTLRRWLETPRRWRETLAVVLAAGQGLIAAHAAGLSHRDFKPDNVMVGDDGRVRVMDFGLARAQSEDTELQDPDGSTSSSPLSLRLTQAGALVGTPRYMAPEQLAGGEVTAAADQFAFCVTLWEALYGARPFAGDTPFELATHVLGGRLQPPPRGRSVPGWLRRACERGLAVEPERRWPSMRALLHALARGQARARTRRGLAAVGVLALLGVAWEAQRRWDLARRTAECEASGDEIEVAWSPAREQELRDALADTGLSYAATTTDKLVPLLERQAQAWRQARVDACLDAEVRETWSAETLDRALWCLDERRTQLRSVVDAFTRADPSVLQRAVMTATALHPVAACRDVEQLAGITPPPLESREALREVRADVIRARALERVGRYDAGLELARDALARAEALGWRPLTAFARLAVGILLLGRGVFDEAEVVLEAAYFEAARGDAPAITFEAATALVFVVGHHASRHAEGLRWGRLAELALDEMADGDGLHRAKLLGNVASVYFDAGDLDEARARYEEALRLREATLGPDNTMVGSLLGDLAHIPFSTGDYDEAKALLARSLAIQEAALGPDHPHVGTSVANIAALYATTGDMPRAKLLFERALAIHEAASGTGGDAVAAKLLDNLAGVHRNLGDLPQAKALMERSLAILEEALGPDTLAVATVLENLGDLQAELGDSARARALIERALAIREARIGPDHPTVAFDLAMLAEIAVAQGRPTDAIPLAERATRGLETEESNPFDLAFAKIQLARGLWDAPQGLGRDRARATMLAEQARETLRGLGASGEPLLAKVDQWLREHRPTE